jgi:putative restriction endonuclease
MHNFGESDDDYELLERILESPDKINDRLIEQVSPPRKTVATTINRKLRDISFKSRVLTAYGFECAFCGMQLKLVDAAHIKDLKPIIKVPPSVNDRPHIDYIKQANHVRGWF